MAEIDDLNIMKDQIEEIKINCFDLQVAYSRMDVTTLQHCGHRTVASACESAVKRANGKIAALIKIHLKKYPD